MKQICAVALLAMALAGCSTYESRMADPEYAAMISRHAADHANETYEEWAARMDAQDAANALRNAESVHYNTCRNNC